MRSTCISQPINLRGAISLGAKQFLKQQIVGWDSEARQTLGAKLNIFGQVNVNGVVSKPMPPNQQGQGLFCQQISRTLPAFKTCYFQSSVSLINNSSAAITSTF